MLSGPLLAMVVLLLSGCTYTYTTAGRTFTDPEAALAYAKKINAEKARSVPRTTSFEGSLMISLPSDDFLLSAEHLTGTTDLAPEQKEYLLRSFKNDAEAIRDAVSHAGLFESAVVTQGNDHLQIAADLGYQYVFKYEEKPYFSLTEVASGRSKKFDATGLANLVLLMESTMKVWAAESHAKVAAEPTKGSRAAIPMEEMAYDDATKRGWVSINAKGLSARRELLRRIAEICATKNKLLVSDDSQVTGTFKVLNEELKDGTLKIYFESFY